MISFDCEQDKTLLVFQDFVGDGVDVEISNINGEIDCSFTIPQADFAKMIDTYVKENKILSKNSSY